ncbi:calcium-binding and coiled-coil domain-containing protein 2-like [Pecten maximus]|uniref:calcium-binding and coiled-coil domain-containing protein 2-like n=1 Tax=Pecten maximus TaxID=6579 RepID=UPI001458F927|nr:calcium-binding and coiled-coil domain-containing protein 2-like [Pecten maximus]
MSNIVKDCDLDLECVNPVEDLVLFQPIRGACIRGQNIVARYSLGSEFTPSSWDWVGLFQEGWDSYRDYISYHWAPSTVIDPRRTNRRSVLFTSEDFEPAKTLDDNFKFLYVTAWNHVVGVSPSFRLEGVIGEDEDLCFDLLENSIERPLNTNLLAKRKFSALELFPDKGDLHFDVLERSLQGVKKPKSSLKPFTFVHPLASADICHPLKLDGDLEFDLLENMVCQQQQHMQEQENQKNTESTESNVADNRLAVSKAVAKKEKVLTVVRDHETLMSTFGPERELAPDMLQLLYLYPVVRNYVENKERSVVPYDVPKPIFDINTIATPPKVTEMPQDQSKSEANIPELEFPVRLPIMPGPKSVLLNMGESSKRCKTCAFGKTTATDFIRQEERADKAMNKLREEIRSLKKQIQHAKTQKKADRQAKRHSLPRSD